MPDIDATNRSTASPPEVTAAPAVGRFQPPGPTFSDWIAQAEYLANTPPGLGLPVELGGNPHAIVMRMQFAEALNIPLMVAIQDLYVMDNRVGMRAELIRALMVRAGHQYSFPHHDDRVCVMRLRRADHPDSEQEVVWTMEEAEQAGLLSNAKTGSHWRAYPGDCLVAAATRRMARRHTPELTKGFAYGRDELALASANAPFAVNAQQLAAQVAEVVDEAHTARTVKALRAVCNDAKERSLLDQVTDEHGPACGETLRVYLLARWDEVAGDKPPQHGQDLISGRPVAESAPPQTDNHRSGPVDGWVHPDCGACKMMAVLINGDHDPGCAHRIAPVHTEEAPA